MLAGRQGPLVQPANGEHLVDRIPRSREVLLEGGHLIWEDAAVKYGRRSGTGFPGGIANYVPRVSQAGISPLPRKSEPRVGLERSAISARSCNKTSRVPGMMATGGDSKTLSITINGELKRCEF